jgi:hypothetical protein
MLTEWVQVLILMDNSGADAILGVIPFARELIIKGAKVILACNSLVIFREHSGNIQATFREHSGLPNSFTIPT